LTGMSEAIDALKKSQMLTNGHVYVTRGSEGCNWLEKAAVRHHVASASTIPNRDARNIPLRVALKQGDQSWQDEVLMIHEGSCWV
ncbi:hypothetical protein MJN76_28725, partial [Salmonella enterica subsp. enterica serovar Anatum]|nr:hypothetical protein [Salmonella enterica subsp. enterica serovar Anatum]